MGADAQQYRVGGDAEAIDGLHAADEGRAARDPGEDKGRRPVRDDKLAGHDLGAAGADDRATGRSTGGNVFDAAGAHSRVQSRAALGDVQQTASEDDRSARRAGHGFDAPDARADFGAAGFDCLGRTGGDERAVSGAEEIQEAAGE